MSDRIRIAGVVLGLCLCAAVSFAGPDGDSDSFSGETLELTIGGAYEYTSGVHDIQARLRRTQAADFPEVRRYMILVDSGMAGPVDLEGFGTMLAERGFLEIAAVYLREALRYEPENAVYWTNLGSVWRQMGDNSSAIDAFQKAIAIDPGMAIAHYNLGVAFDAKGKYDKAIDQYVRAFTIDPSLADPRVNPQVVNNLSLPAASLLLYQRRAGNQSLPLISVGEMDPEMLEVNVPIPE